MTITKNQNLIKPFEKTKSSAAAQTIICTVIMVLMFGASKDTVRGQWTTSGNNINNTNTGNVGVGTSTPNAKLEVAGANVVPRITNTDAASYGGLQLFENGTLKLGIHSLGSGSGSSYVGGANGAQIWNFANGPLVFGTNSAERMRLTATGFLGIGTTVNAVSILQLGGSTATLTLGAEVPETGPYKITVTGSGGATPSTKGTGHGRNLIVEAGASDNTGGTTGGDLYLRPGFPRAPATVYGNILLADQGGNVGVGTAAPAYKLDVQGGQVNATGLCIAGDCKTAWSQVGGGGGSQWITSGSNVHYSSGNVGIGTSTPAAKLELAANSAIKLGNAYFSSGGDYLHLATNEWYNGSSWVQSAPGALIQISGQVVNFYRHDGSGHTHSVAIDSSGNMGVGTPTPTAKLHVSGDGRVTGNLVVDGNIAAKYQDLAEWVPAARSLPAGTVVTLDPSTSNQVMASSKAYDTRVAGVVSDQPGISLGERGDNKLLIAHTGRVLVNVDASAGGIQIGDLLVTSDTQGFATKSQPVEIAGVQIHRPGTIIGKALEPLAQGRGKILVLLSLQ